MFSRPQARIEKWAAQSGADAHVVDVPPIWIRSDFLPTPDTGRLLAREAVLPWIGGA